MVSIELYGLFAPTLKPLIGGGGPGAAEEPTVRADAGTLAARLLQAAGRPTAGKPADDGLLARTHTGRCEGNVVTTEVSMGLLE